MLGLQAVGTVVEVGPSGGRTRIGTKVMSYLAAGGGYVQFAVAPAKLSVQLPNTWSVRTKGDCRRQPPSEVIHSVKTYRSFLPQDEFRCWMTASIN